MVYISAKICLYFCLVLEEAEPEHYSKLQSTSEDVYSEAYYAASPFKTRPGTLLYKTGLFSV